MKIGRSPEVLIDAHAALTKSHGVANAIQDTAPLVTHAAAKTGVHAVAGAYLAKTSVAGQTLGDAEIPAAIARDDEVATAVSDEATARDIAIAAEALLRANADGALSTEIDDDVAAEAIARDEAIAAENHPTIIRKTADQIVSNSEALQNDDHLLLAMAANEVWEFLVYLLASSPTGDPDINTNFSVPGGASYYFKSTATTVIVGANDENFALIAETRIGVLHGIVINGATPGSLQFQWAQLTATVEDTKLLTNSYLMAQRVL